MRMNEKSKEISDKLQAKLAEIEAQKNADLETMTLEGRLQAAQGREITGKI